MNCVKSDDKKYKTRPSPPYPANQCPEGLIKIGNDGNKWIIKKAANGVNRWVKYTGTQQHTSKSLQKSIQKSIQKPIQKSIQKPLQKPVQKPIQNFEKLTVTKLKQYLDKKGIKYKKTAKKSELLALLSKPIALQQKSIPKKSSGKTINLNQFKDGKVIDLSPLGKYTVESSNDNNFYLHLKNYGETVTPKFITYTPKVYDVDELREKKINTNRLKIGDILNLGDYRLFNGFIVTYNDKNQLYLQNYVVNDYFTIPKQVSKLFENPVKVYSEIDDVNVVEMTFPNGFLQKEYGLTPNLHIPSDITFEYVIFADQLDIMKPSIGRGFTVQSTQKGQKLAKYIIQKSQQI
jgi:hypothetical protein